MTYPGGKGGVYQKIINLIPPHKTYIETHLGGGAILLNKKPAIVNIGIDMDIEVINKWSADLPPSNRVSGAQFQFLNKDAVNYIKKSEFCNLKQTFVYCDPPYLHITRKDKNIYKYEYTDSQHEELLTVIKDLPCQVMISGYESKLYTKSLEGWHSKTFQAMTRHGLATEWVWMNYPEPIELHDYSYIGDNFRERERIRKKVNRWVGKLRQMPILERQAIITAINNEDRS